MLYGCKLIVWQSIPNNSGSTEIERLNGSYSQ